MSKRRDRHQRGIRGPIALPNPLMRSRVALVPATPSERFTAAIETALAQVAEYCPEALIRIDVGFEDVPTEVVGWNSQIPLASATSATDERHGQVILYRRPIERRAAGKTELEQLVRLTIVEQLSGITGFTQSQIDPHSEED